jgi:hypothetical protein
MRYLFVTKLGVIDSLTGELSERPSIEQLLLQRPGGVIAGRNLYPMLAGVVNEARRDAGWTASISAQRQQIKSDRVGGIIYFSHLHYRFAKIRRNGVRFRPGSIKWLVLNLELFCESEDIEGAARALVTLAERRGITPRYSPGSYGGAMLRASSAWEPDRQAAPRFISDAAREQLPGNYYALRDKYHNTSHAYYLDQQSSHHTIAATIDLPNPKYLHARGYYRAVEDGRTPRWVGVNKLDRHVGLLHAVVECDFLPPSVRHLYPPWAKQRGRRGIWIWTPELRLLDRRIRLQYVSAALTSYEPDLALREYGQWSLTQLKNHKHDAIKSALLAAYGMLGIRTKREIEKYSVHSRGKPPKAETVKLPLMDEVYRSTIKRMRTPSIQNVIARGVIEAETRTRSIEYARQLESEGHDVVHIYADGLLTTAIQLPFLPDGWRVHGALSEVSSPNSSSIVSRELVRLPGIPNGRRTAYMRKDRPDEADPSQRSSLHLRECEPAPNYDRITA